MIEKITATVFYSRKAGRRYFTRKAAIAAEARAVIKGKYPTETGEWDDMGRMTYGGFHWEQDLYRADVLFRRLCRLIKNSC